MLKLFDDKLYVKSSSYDDEVIYREEHLEILIFVSEQVAMAIDRVRAEEELIKYRDHLEELVKERTQELKQRAEELAKANEELKELDKRKTEFLSTVSHELRTPLTPIKQYLQNMLSEMYGAVNEKQKKRSEMALTCVNDEARLIENLLDLVRIQENRIQTDLEFGSIADIVHRIIHRFEYSAKEKHLELKLNMPDEDCLMINIDREKIRQIITNLVHNAIKFTEKGTVTVSVFSENEKIKVCVSDTGIGIPDSQIEKIFERFYQIDSSFTRKVGGTGIGLNIVKKFVELHGGKIWVENNKDCAGTCFTFTLPKGQEVEII
jgi:signal transduction histidine kinase